MSRPHLLLLAFAALTLSAAGAADAQGRPDSVSLRFAWPVGTTARVQHEWVRVQSSPERRDSLGVRSTYRLTLLEHAEGRLVRVDSFAATEVFGLPSTGPDGGAGARHILTQLGAMQPSYVVSRDGEFRHVEDVARLKASIDSMFAPLLKDLGDMPAEAKALMEAATSEQVLNASAAQDWNATVGTWTGVDWAIGDVYAAAIEEPVPLLPGLKIPMRYEFSAVERVPCTEAERRRACVRLEMQSEPDSAALRKFVGEMMARLGGGAQEILKSLENMRTTNEVTVIADPKTLLPYRVTRVQRIEVRGTEPGQTQSAVSTRLDARTARYTYR